MRQAWKYHRKSTAGRGENLCKGMEKGWWQVCVANIYITLYNFLRDSHALFICSAQQPVRRRQTFPGNNHGSAERLRDSAKLALD